MPSQERARTAKASDELTLAWAAGLFEGEGFLVRRKVGKRVYLQVGIEMRDLDVMERFVAALVEHGLEATRERQRRFTLRRRTVAGQQSLL